MGEKEFIASTGAWVVVQLITCFKPSKLQLEPAQNYLIGFKYAVAFRQKFGCMHAMSGKPYIEVLLSYMHVTYMYETIHQRVFYFLF